MGFLCLNILVSQLFKSQIKYFPKNCHNMNMGESSGKVAFHGAIFPAATRGRLHKRN